MQLIFILELSRPGTDPNSDAAMTEQQVTLHGLARRWRWAMRVAARGAGGEQRLDELESTTSRCLVHGVARRKWIRQCCEKCLMLSGSIVC